MSYYVAVVVEGRECVSPVLEEWGTCEKFSVCSSLDGINEQGAGIYFCIYK